MGINPATGLPMKGLTIRVPGNRPASPPGEALLAAASPASTEEARAAAQAMQKDVQLGDAFEFLVDSFEPQEKSLIVSESDRAEKELTAQGQEVHGAALEEKVYALIEQKESLPQQVGVLLGLKAVAEGENFEKERKPELTRQYQPSAQDIALELLTRVPAFCRPHVGRSHAFEVVRPFHVR